MGSKGPCLLDINSHLAAPLSPLPLRRCMTVFPRLRVTDFVQVTPVLPHGTFSAVTLNKPLVSLANTYWQSPRKE